MAVSRSSAGGGVSLSLLPLALALLCVPTYDASVSVYIATSIIIWHICIINL